MLICPGNKIQAVSRTKTHKHIITLDPGTCHILEALNGLGPAPGAERPSPDEAYAAEIAGWQARAKVDEVAAAVFKAIEHAQDPTPETKALVAAVRKAKGPEPGADQVPLPAEPWLAALAAWLRGQAPALDVPGDD